ncbi:MAG: T9SS type A sorting domain-containing protein [Bacteroidota bacterium]
MKDVAAQLFRRRSFAGILLSWLLSFSFTAAQNATDYFPSNTGNTWKYERFSLDTLQNPIINSMTIVSDSLGATGPVRDTAAFFLLSGSKPQFDTTFVNVQGSTISEFDAGFPRITTMLPVDSLGLSFVWDYLNWYPYMKFALTPGVRDTLLYIKNKTVQFQGHPLTLIIYVTTTRLPDTSITVPAGTHLATPFRDTLFVNLPKSVAPLGHIEVPLFQLVNTWYVSKGHWLVEEIQPSTFYPLNNDPLYNVAKTQLPGFVRVLESASITSVRDDAATPRQFTLEQNFPNPFNPTTDLRFTIADLRFVTLKIFDVLGQEVATLVNSQLRSGSYDVKFDARSLSTGVYFYQLSAGGTIQTKKMLLTK